MKRCLVLAAMLVVAPAAAQFAYQDLPAATAFPAQDFMVQGFVLGDDQANVRAHAWRLWAGLTAPIEDRTFQTFWWMPSPSAPAFAGDRPASIRPPFDNYEMCTAYSTVSPRGSDGRLPICFNPYLETDLGATRPYTMDGRTFPPDPMAGTRANCMNCHRRAGYPAFDAKTASADFGHVYNDGYRSPNDPYFERLLKTDFMWSIAFKNVMP